MPASREYALLPLFREFISKSEKGRRVQYPGRKMAKGTTRQYGCVYQLVAEFEGLEGEPLRLLSYNGNAAKVPEREQRYWRRRSSR